MSFEALPDDSHRQIDQDTVTWALEQRPCLIEGRFLDAVFAGAAVPATLILLDASDTQRVGRARKKNSTFTFDHLRRTDADDAKFRARLYGPLNNIASYLTVDTSELTVDECAYRITMAIEKARRAGQPA